MSGQVAAYLRNDDVIVVPQGGGGGYTFDVEPVLVVAPASDAVGEAIALSLETSAAAQGHDPRPPGPYRSPALKAVRARSYAAFYKNSAYCFVYEEDGALILLRFKPARDRRGFEMTNEEPIVVRDRAELGRVVLDSLRELPRMP
jgi:hypothetical protein